MKTTTTIMGLDERNLLFDIVIYESGSYPKTRKGMSVWLKLEFFGAICIFMFLPFC